MFDDSGNPVLQCGLRVLVAERDGLTRLAATLDGTFVQAAERMLDVKGRIIVCGMGKSGHIARKLAASLASTGTPAQFVHAGEACHGDLGMITPQDLVLALSRSGETFELAAIIAHCHRSAVPLLAVTSTTDSALAKKADIVLVLPDVAEACSEGLVPTTSSTMMLALGDALTIALMDQRAFGVNDFHALHPRGSLGIELLEVSELMHSGIDLPAVRPGDGMDIAILEMTRKGFGAVAVLDDTGLLHGVITDGDLRRHMDGLLKRTAADVMTSRPHTIAKSALASDALHIMNTQAITSIIVTDANNACRAVGILHLHDCLRAGMA